MGLATGWRRSRRAAVIAVAFAALAATGCATSPPAPIDQMAVARAAIDEAVSTGSAELAPVTLRSAQDKLNHANAAMAKHDYRDARFFAEAAESDAKLAAATARSRKAQRAVTEVESGIQALKEEVARGSAR